MPDKSSTTDTTNTEGSEPIVAAVSGAKTLFHFPTIGHGVSIEAVSEQEAKKVALQLQ